MTTTSPDGPPGGRRTGGWVLVTGVLALVALAIWRVPWQPVPGGTPAPVDAEAYFGAGYLARAEAFTRWSRVLSWTSLALSLGVSLVLGFSRAGRMLSERLVGRVVRRWWSRTLLVTVAVLLVGRLVTLPFAAALQDHQRDAALTTQGWPSWARDVAVTFALESVVTALLVVCVVGLARWLPRLWPLVVGGVLAAFVMIGSLVYPLLVEPLFNSFEPLEDGELRSQILVLAEREGVAVDEVLVSDASRRTATFNAYVSGYGGTRRVVVYDTLVRSMSTAEARSVVAHELAHAKYDDVLTGSLLGAAGVFAGAGLLGVLTGRRRGTGRAVVDIDQPGGVPRLLALVAVATLLATPVQNTVSRLIETRADVVALQTTGASGPGGSSSGDAFVRMQLALARQSLTDPTPPRWSYWSFASHPTVLERIAIERHLTGQD